MRLLHIVLWTLGVLAWSLAQVKGRCVDDQWECDNGFCIDDNDRCDGSDDCFDGSDEDDCDDVVGLAVGLTIAGIFLFIVCPICICVIVFCCVYHINRSSRPYPGVYRTTAAPTTTVYTAGVTQSTVPVYPVAGGYKPQDPPPPYAATQEMLAYPPPAEYPQQPTGYPQQSAPAGYPQQPAGYPQQQPPTGYDQPVDYAPPSYPPAPYPTQPYPSAEPYPM